MNKLFTICTVAAGLAIGQAVWAQSAVTSTFAAQRVDMVDGKPVLQPAAQSKPGDIIEYSSTYKNGGASAAEKLLATVPVPAGTTLIAGSAQPAQALASTDGVAFAPMPLMRSVHQPDGSQRSEAVPLADYRALRWSVGTLGAGGSVVVSLRVRIDSPVIAAPAGKPTL